MSKLIVVLGIAAFATGWWLLTVWVTPGVSEERSEPELAGGTFFPAPVPRTGEFALDRQRLREAYATFLNSNDSLNRWTTFTDAAGTVPLSLFLTALDARINQPVMELLDQQLWQLYRCPFAEQNMTKGSDIVFSLRFSVRPPEEQATLPLRRERGLSTWESTMVRDLAPILFPISYYSSLPVTTQVFVNVPEISVVSVREIPVMWPDGRSTVFSYVLAGDELLIGTNRECLLRAQELLYDTSA